MTPITVNSGSASTTEQGVYLGCLSFDTCGSHGERAWQAPVGIIPVGAGNLHRLQQTPAGTWDVLQERG